MESPVDSLTALEGKAREVLRLSVADKDTVKAAEFLQVFLNSLPPDGIEAFSQDIIRNQAPNDLCQFHDSLLSGLCVLCKSPKRGEAIIRVYLYSDIYSEGQEEITDPF